MPKTRGGSRPGLIIPALAAVALAAGACGGGSKSPAALSSPTSPASSPASASTPTTSASGGGGGQLSQLTNEMNSATDTTFKAVYTGNSDGQTSTITIEQAPPKSVFGSGTSEVISDGSQTYFCDLSDQKSCVAESGPNPLASIVSLYSPKTYISVLQAAEAATAAHVAGYDVSFATKTIAGQPSNCVTVGGGGSTGTYCVTDSGILASVTTGADSFTLTSYTTDVPASDFQIPSGATTQTVPQVTLPSGVTLPPG